MDKILPYLWSIGYSTKQTHDLKPTTKVKILARHFGFIKIPELRRKQAKQFLASLNVSDEMNADSFGLAFHKHMIQMLPSIEKQDLTVHQIVITNLPGSKFYQTPEWRELRYRVLEHYGNKCMACGRGPSVGIIIHVDHILPRSIYPEHALNFDNMQVLCEDCNIGKSNKFEKDWRK